MTSDQNKAIFKSEDGKISFDVPIDTDTVWLTQKQMAELFNKNRKTITEHIRNIFKEKELEEKVVCRKIQQTTQHGAMAKKTQTKNVNSYNLDVIISVGYRVKSKRGTQFRQWATKILNQHLIQGYSINEKRLIERKIELEVKQSSDILNRIFSMKGTNDSNEAQQVIEKVSKYIGSTTDKETMVLKAQILIERFMIQFLKNQAKNEDALENSRFTFRHLITMTQLQHKPKEKDWLWEILNKLCKIRNNFAHVLEINLVENDIKEFIRICNLRLKKEGLSIEKENKELKIVLVYLCGVVSSIFQENI